MTGLKKTVVECAFEYAQDGSCGDLREVRKKLKRDGFLIGQIEDHLHGRELRLRLARLCRASQA